ncbi:hypothetical protein IC235_11985 [Hymenobacter sp. BT664]|uniref:Immunity protein 10 n=1 Tax=Hymenobacter montanus TaxID=2771359 RepID=A0A927BD43_9BACT|nr:Imm10 family immunity protein [Hymenobacter montanus]MBD2768607.1 hypothetical protein [Hymenobacter montanus]
MIFEFHASEFEIDAAALRVGFAEGENGEHYFIMQRDEEFTEEPLSNLENIYTERDDQCWGGYGGINQVSLNRNSLIIDLNPEMANQMGGYETIKITFSTDNLQFQQLQKVLQQIMQDYESKLNFV